jgi:prepilin-type N-terminal cleavage/methylation domain-containing protein
MSSRYRGLSVIELLVVLAIIAVLTGIGIVSLPRQGMTMNQGQRIFGTAIQFARFEAIKRNVPVAADFTVDQTAVEVRDVASGGLIRRYELDPLSNSVSIKAVTPATRMVFNARGVATAPVSRVVRIGIVGQTGYDRTLNVSGQGHVERGS